MNQNRNAHILGLLAALAMQLAGVWASAETDLAAKIAMSIAAGFALVFANPTARSKALPLALAVVAVAVPLVAFWQAKVSPGAVAFGILSTVAAVLTRLQALLPAQPIEQKPEAKGSDMKSIVSVLVVIAALGSTSCKTTPTSPDSFFGAVVTCTKQNSHNDQAGAAVLNCLVNAAGGNYGACLAGLTAAGYWTVEEIACVVRQYATESAQRLNAGVPTPSDAVILERANAWIKANQVRYQ